MNKDLFSLYPKIVEIIKPIALSTNEQFLKQKQIHLKDAPTNFTSVVTDVDEKNDDYLREKLSLLLPEAGIISEENNDSILEKELIWTIDPIDGTFNYSKQIPVYGIIVALWKNKQPSLVVLSYPQFNEFLVLDEDRGIIVNGDKVSKFDDSLNDIFYADVSKDFSERQKLEKDMFELTNVSPMRVYSSAYMTRLFSIGLVNRVVIRDAAIWDLAGLILAAKIRKIKYKILPETDWFDPAGISEYNKQIVVGNEFFDGDKLLLEL